MSRLTSEPEFIGKSSTMSESVLAPLAAMACRSMMLTGRGCGKLVCAMRDPVTTRSSLIVAAPSRIGSSNVSSVSTPASSVASGSSSTCG
jgi:hypothetical protein